MNYPELFKKNKEQTISGRYICLKHIEHLLLKYPVEIIGKSVLGKPIYKYQIGIGDKRVLMWSQMHGNESTTTKALFDFFNFLHSKDKVAKEFLNQFTFCFLPMLNPDGAEKYTRENSNGIDLNRDAIHLSQPESVTLRNAFENFKPHFLFEDYFINRINFLLKLNGFILFNTMVINKNDEERNLIYKSKFGGNYSLRMYPKVEEHNELFTIKKLV